MGKAKARALLRRIIEENPKGNRASWSLQFMREAMDDRDLQRAVVEDVFADILKDLRRSEAN